MDYGMDHWFVRIHSRIVYSYIIHIILVRYRCLTNGVWNLYFDARLMRERMASGYLPFQGTSCLVSEDDNVTSWIFLLCFNAPVFIIVGFTVSQLSFLGSRLASVLLWVSLEACCLIGWSRVRKPIRPCYWLVFRGLSSTDIERLNANWVRQNALEPARGRLPWALLGAKPHGKCDIAYISRMLDIL